jgi:hypothetical protein
MGRILASRFLEGARHFTLLGKVQIISGAPPPLRFKEYYEGSFPGGGVKWPVREADQSFTILFM